jgi:hypothetical protein
MNQRGLTSPRGRRNRVPGVGPLLAHFAALKTCQSAAYSSWRSARASVSAWTSLPGRQSTSSHSFIVSAARCPSDAQTEREQLIHGHQQQEADRGSHAEAWAARAASLPSNTAAPGIRRARGVRQRTQPGALPVNGWP